MGARLGVEAVLLDLDGTLIDSIPALRDAYGRFLDVHAPTASPPPFDRWNGVFLGEVVRILQAELGISGGADELLREYESILEECYVESATSAPGAEALLDELASAQIRTAVVTSGARRLALPVLERAGMMDRFDTVVTADDVARAKPAPDGYLEGLRRLSVSAEDAVVIEDGLLGVQAAVAAGLRCIVLAEAGAPWIAESGAIAVIGDLGEALEALIHVGA